MKMNEINIRDPFILIENDQYYLYGSRAVDGWGECSGLDVYTSKDLEDWSEPIEAFSKPEGFWSGMNYWAPEVHKYKGKFYMFVSFKSETRERGTQILVSDVPEGPFGIHSDGPVTPESWGCLDGTLYIDKDQTPYMVFCHEWTQVVDGEMCALKLSDDLKEAVGEPFLLFKASQPQWMPKDEEKLVTDGPFMYRTKGGKLLMLWSTFVNDQYVEAIAYSDNGDITGNWKHADTLLFSKDGGHGMLFNTMDSGELKFIFHTPNDTPNERPAIVGVRETDDMLFAE